MTLIDTHTHIYLSAFDNDRHDMVARARQAGVQKFYLPAIDSETTAALLQLEETYPGHCFAMMGLHPCSVHAGYQDELRQVERWLQQRAFCAIGETGLDFYWDTTYSTQQYEAFHTQINWALQYNRPIVIHTRKAMQETIDVVNSYKGRGLRGVFHCFGDSYAMAKQILDAGFLLGIGGVVTYKNAGLDTVLPQVPLDRIVLETDAPYLTPVPHRGKRNESSYLPLIVSRLAEIYKTDRETVAETTTAVAEKLFS